MLNEEFKSVGGMKMQDDKQVGNWMCNLFPNFLIKQFYFYIYIALEWAK